MTLLRSWIRSFACVLFAVSCALTASAAPVLKVLFLGDNGHHKPSDRLRELAPTLMDRGIQLVYTEDPAALSLPTLKRYDALLVYANIDKVSTEQEQALLDYVNQGGGLVALHCASACLRASDRYVALVGAQFKSHGTGTFRTRVVAPENPVVKDYPGFESWDETYVHSRHNEQGRTVLEMREQEPWTWIRREGNGRVFYTAWGHDERTWTNPGFHDLVERGVRYAAGQVVPAALADRPKIPALTYVDQPGIPYYPPGQRSRGEAPWPRMQNPLTPEQSMQRLVVPAGFEVQLVAAEPAITRPVTMNWDERGRLWIAETLDYPNIVRPLGTPGRDRIVTCEDTDGDGRMDKFTVFAEGLNIPTSLTFSRGGVIVHQAPDTLFLKDTDGDGKADIREVLFTGWSRRDTHAGPSNLNYGLDNWIWGMVGYSGFSGSVGGEAQNFRQGFYRFRPDGSQLEFLRATNNNTWGFGMREDGVVFGSTANNNPSVYLPIANRYYAPAGLDAKTLGTIANTARFLALSTRVRQVDVHWGYTAAAGHAFYTARNYPREYWNRVAFVAEPTGHVVGEFVPEADEANFRASNPSNLIVSDDEWFAPIMAEVGPDGAVWVIDWYNYIVQHNPTPAGFLNGKGNAYDNPLRDQRYGRIYRIVWKGDASGPVAPFSLADASPAQLVAALAHDNLFWRRHAQRLLVERGRKDVLPALLQMVSNREVDDLGLNVGAIHALWTLQGLNAIDAYPPARDVAVAALGHPSPAVRRNAVAVLPRTVQTIAAVLKEGLLLDKDPQVRLAALLALADAPEVPAAGAALQTLLTSSTLKADVWTIDAAKMAATRQQRSFLKATTPEQMAAARAVPESAAGKPFLLDSFEPAGHAHTPAVAASPLEKWQLEAPSAQGTLALSETGRGAGRALQLTVPADGTSATAARKIPVLPNRRYELAGWVKTEDVLPTGNGLGAFFTLPQIQQPQRAVSIGIKGTTPWTQVRVTFVTGRLTELQVVAALGGLSATSRATGTAWFDDLWLTDLGPADETISDPFGVVLAHVLKQAEGDRRPAGSAENETVTATLELGVVPDVMQYDVLTLTVQAGQKARLVFKNNDHMQHNAVFVLPAKVEAVGALADAMLTDPQAVAKNYVPSSPDVLFATPMVNPGESHTLTFTAPAEPGRYPYVCTFPGHWRLMQGVLIVTAP